MEGRKTTRIALALAAISFAGTALAAEPGAGLQLDWLAGQWCSQDPGGRIDEAWLPEAGGTLLGMSRTVRGTKTASFEFMRIVSEGGRASFHVQPNGAPATAFALEDRGEGWIRFANPAHDFPNRIEYRRAGDRLSAWIAGPGPDGKDMRIPFDYQACATGR